MVVHIQNASMFALSRTVIINKWEIAKSLDLENMDIVVEDSLQDFGK